MGVSKGCCTTAFFFYRRPADKEDYVVIEYGHPKIKQTIKLLGIKRKLKKAQEKAINNGLNGHNLLVIAPIPLKNPPSFKSRPCSRSDYEDAVSVIKERLQKQMLFLLRKTSDGAGLDTAAQKLREDYTDISNERWKKFWISLKR